MITYALFLKRLQTESGFVYMPSSKEIIDAEDRGWQFRIAVYPESRNLTTAAQAVGELFCAFDLEFKCLVLNDPMQPNLEALGWDGTQTQLTHGSDRDQRGKEICVYMRYASQQQRYEREAKEWKHIMLRAWKCLEDAQLNFGYILPPPGDHAVTTEAGIVTPFSYTANKPWQGRHGILHSHSYNPYHYPDPLAEVKISKHDLLEYGISLKQMLIRHEQCFVYHQQHLQIAKNQWQLELSRLAAAKQNNFTQVFSRLEEWLDQQPFDNLPSRLVENQHLLHDLLASCPRQADAHLSDLPALSELMHSWRFLAKSESGSAQDLATLKALLQALKTGAQDELKATLQECSSIADFGEDCNALVQTHPVMLQRLYRRAIHISQEEAALAKALKQAAYSVPVNPLLEKFSEDQEIHEPQLLTMLSEFHLFERLHFLAEAFSAIIANASGQYKIRQWQGFFETQNQRLSDKQLADIAKLETVYLACLQTEPYDESKTHYNLQLKKLTQASPLVNFNATRFKLFTLTKTHFKKQVDNLVEGKGRSGQRAPQEVNPFYQLNN